MEGIYRQPGHSLDYTPVVAVAAGQLLQLPDGRAAVAPVAIAAGELGAVQVCGVADVAKQTGITLLPGGKTFWDHSANVATFRTVNDRDFYAGVVLVEAAAAATTVRIALNVLPCYLIDLARDPATTATTGTAAAEGFGRPKRIGGTTKFLLTATNEAQKVDLLSNQAFAVNANGIVEARINVVSDGAGTAVDVSVGIANATHATDADAIAEHLLVHLDANAADIKVQSKDGTTTVAATDTTLDYVEGTAYEVWIDTRDPADVKVYVNGVRVLDGTTGAATTLRLDGATGPVKLLVHVEKTSSTDAYELDIDWLRVRTSEQ